ncbi:MAG: hypothetical protein LAT75_14375 [Candidatus Cyclonatronum sp.]|uniref:hypothetical protein n=1 Tax=Cyclonatronum sp. TaxID=3024185 RepID=UPI0025BC77C9|nr:hypothetical protein [Cyclonatronum sp.]MCH8488045.1 hypothetical protein [Cyclonatronum sp.]
MKTKQTAELKIRFLFESLHPCVLQDDVYQKLIRQTPASVLKNGNALTEFLLETATAAALPDERAGGFVNDAVQLYRSSASPDDSLYRLYTPLGPVAADAPSYIYQQLIRGAVAELWAAFRSSAVPAWEGKGSLKFRLLWEELTERIQLALEEERRAAAQLAVTADPNEQDRLRLSCFVFQTLHHHLFTLLHAVQYFLSQPGDAFSFVRPVEEVYPLFCGKPWQPDRVFAQADSRCTEPDCTHSWHLLSELGEPVFTKSMKPYQKRDYLEQKGIPVLEISRERHYLRTCDISRLTQKLLLNSKTVA